MLVSTQLIEAGVDVDFPVVFRAWAPADSLQQAAGRANRNARLAEGRVVIFAPSDGGQPGDASYKAALARHGQHFGPGRADPDDLAELERYYPERYSLQNLERQRPGRRDRGATRRELDFPAVAARSSSSRSTPSRSRCATAAGSSGRGSTRSSAGCAAGAASAGWGGPAAAARTAALTWPRSPARWPAGPWPPGTRSRSSGTCSNGAAPTTRARHRPGGLRYVPLPGGMLGQHGGDAAVTQHGHEITHPPARWLKWGP